MGLERGWGGVYGAGWAWWAWPGAESGAGSEGAERGRKDWAGLSSTLLSQLRNLFPASFVCPLGLRLLSSRSEWLLSGARAALRTCPVN